MREFRPSRLHEALGLVREKHPSRASALESGDLEGSMLADALLRKLRGASDFESLAKSLSTTEGRFVGWLITHHDRDVRLAVRGIARYRPELLSTEQLWLGYQMGRDDQLRAALRGREDMEPLQRRLVEAETSDPFFSAVRWEGLSLEEGFAAARVRVGPLRDAIEADGVATGRLEFWHLFDVIGLRARLTAQPAEVAVRTWEAFVANNREAAAPALVADWAVATWLEVVKRRLMLLGDMDQSGRQFVEHLLMWLELKGFFGDDNERFAYWSKYADRMIDVKVDRAEKRLFMEFGPVGVIEFGDVNNAGYVYPVDYFQRLRERNFSPRKLHPSDLKSQEHALHRIIHHAGWQWGVDRVMRRMGV